MSAWKDWEHISKLAPDGWKEQNEIEIQEEEKEIPESSDGSENATIKKSKATWARLIAKIYEIDPLTCPKCGSEMKILSVIMDTCEIKKILKHLSPVNPPGGCRFHSRCYMCTEECREMDPELKDIGDGHRVACHNALMN